MNYISRDVPSLPFEVPVRLSSGELSYAPPRLEVFQVAVELGFSASDDNDEGGGGMVLPEWDII